MKITKSTLKRIIKEELESIMEMPGRRYRHAGERLAARNLQISKEKKIMAVVNEVLDEAPSEEDKEIAHFLINSGQQILGHFETMQAGELTPAETPGLGDQGEEL